MGVAQGLILTSMLDILVTILFFLMNNFSYVVKTFSVAKDLKLPPSTAIIPPPDSNLNLLVTKNGIILDNVELVKFVNGDIAKQDLLGDGVTIIKLAQALQQHKNRSQVLEKKNDAHPFTGLIVLQADET